MDADPITSSTRDDTVAAVEQALVHVDDLPLDHRAEAYSHLLETLTHLQESADASPRPSSIAAN